MARIPQNQERIYLLLNDLEFDLAGLPFSLAPLRDSMQSKLDAIRVHTVDCNRRKPKKRAPIQSDPMDLQKRINILQTIQAHPDWNQQKVGMANNVIAGRVSEVVRGKRK